MNNREIAEHIIGLSLDMSMHDVESIERIEKALDIKDDHATEVQTKLLTQITTLRRVVEFYAAKENWIESTTRFPNGLCYRTDCYVWERLENLYENGPCLHPDDPDYYDEQRIERERIWAAEDELKASVKALREVPAYREWLEAKPLEGVE